MRKTWKLINQTIGNKPKQSKIDKLVVNNQSITDNNKLANEFNEFFVNIGPSLSNEIKNKHSKHDKSRNHMRYLKRNYKSAFFNSIQFNSIYFHKLIKPIKMTQSYRVYIRKCKM